MISQRTTLILGAGSNFNYGFPLGRKLISDILALATDKINILELDYNARNLSEITRKKFELMTEFREALNTPSAPSIDWFLKQHPKYMSVGKQLIIEIILRYEQKCKNNVESDEDPFYRQILDAIRTEKSADLKKNQLSIVTFNYDRSLEHYLYKKLKGSYSEDPQEVDSYLKENLKIVHVYGKIAPLHWQAQKGECPISFGPDNNLGADEILNCFENLQTIGEVSGTNASVEKAKDCISQAKRIIFLGFGYLEQNMKYLNLKELTYNKSCYGTCVGLTSLETDLVARRLDKKIGNYENLDNSIFFGQSFHECEEFLRNNVLLEN